MRDGTGLCLVAYLLAYLQGLLLATFTCQLGDCMEGKKVGRSLEEF